MSLQRYLPGWSRSSPDALSLPIISGDLLRASEGRERGRDVRAEAQAGKATRPCRCGDFRS